MRMFRTNSSKTTFEESLVKFRQRLRTRGYPKTIIESSFQVLKQTLRVVPIHSRNEGHLFSWLRQRRSGLREQDLEISTSIRSGILTVHRGNEPGEAL